MNRNGRHTSTPSHDYGNAPLVTDLARLVRQNTNYRTALWTGDHLQLTLMCSPAGGEIGLEVHPDTDQFLRIESGNGVSMMGPAANRLRDQHRITDGYAVFVPAGTWHNIINTGKTPLKLYTVYAPPHHPHGTVQATKADADASHKTK